MRSSLLLLAAAALVLVGFAGRASAADAAFFGKLALIEDPEVARELGLTDETKSKLIELIKKREQEALSLNAKLKGQPLAKQTEILAPFVAESEKLGMALLDDTQVAKLNKLRVAKEGMMGIVAPDIAQKLQLTPDQSKEIGNLLQQHKTQIASANDFQKRMARQMFERRIAGVLTDAQRGTWEQLSGVPAGGSSVAQAPAGSSPSGGAAPAAGAPAAGAGGVAVQRAGASDLAVTEDGQFKPTFVFTPWKTVLEYFANKGGYAFATDKWPQGTLNYTDPKGYTAEQMIDLLNMHLMTKGFMLVKRDKLLRLFDITNDGPVPPEFVPEIAPEDIEKHGEFELVTVTFQLDRWPPIDAEAEINKRKGPYGSVTVLSTSRQLVVTELGGRLRWIKRMIDAVERPDALYNRDEKFAIIRLTRLTPTEFVTTVKQLFGIAADQSGLPDGSLRLAPNDLDNVVYCNGKAAQIERVEALAKQIEGAVAARAGGTGGISIVEQDQFAVYEITGADPVHSENVVRSLLAGKFSSLRVQLDQKTGKLSVWGPRPAHAAIQAILGELQQNGILTEVIKLKKMSPQDALTSLYQIIGGDPSGKSATNGLRLSADLANFTLTISGSAAQVEAAKTWLMQMGELGGQLGGRNGFVGMPEERAPYRVLPLSSRSVRHVLNQLPYMWDNSRAVIRVEGASGEPTTGEGPPGGREALQPRSVTRGTPPPLAPKSEPASKAGKASKGDAKAAPQPAADRPMIPLPKKDDFTRRPLSVGSQYVVFKGEEETADVTATAETAEETAASEAEAEEPAATAGADQPVTTSGQGQDAPAAAAPAQDGQSGPFGPSEIVVRVTPAGIIISSPDLDALDEFQNLLQELVDNYDKGGKRMEVYYLKYAKSDTAVVLVQEMLTGGANLNADNNLASNLAANMFGGGGMGNVVGALLGGGGGGPQVGGTVTSSSSGSSVTITSDPRLNALYVQAMPRDLDSVEQFLQLVDQQSSPEPPEGNKPRFIPVLHGKAADVEQIVRQVYAGRIVGDNTGNRGAQFNPQEMILAAITGGRGGGGGRGGFGGRGGQQQNRGEEPKMTLAVAAESNSLVVGAPDYLFEEVKAFVEAMDVQNIVPDAVVRVVNLKRANTEVVDQSLRSMLGTNATVTRVLPTAGSQLLPGAARGGQQNNNQQNRNNQGGGQQRGQQLDPATLARMQQGFQQFNQGQRGGQGGRGGNQFGGGGNFGRGGQGNFGGGGGPGGGTFGGGNFGGGRGGQPGGGGGANFGGRGGGGPGAGGGGGGNFGGRGGGGGGQPTGGGRGGR